MQRGFDPPYSPSPLATGLIGKYMRLYTTRTHMQNDFLFLQSKVFIFIIIHIILCPATDIPNQISTAVQVEPKLKTHTTYNT